MDIAIAPLAAIQQEILSGTEPVLVDVRTPGEFARLHVPFAHSLPLESLTPSAVEQFRNSDDPIYLICQASTRAATAYRQLQNAGVRGLRVVEGGMTAWASAGLPTVTSGSGAISLERQVRIAAGSLVLLGCLLSWLVQPLFLLIAAFVGAGLIVAGITDVCGMGILLGKLPWNARSSAPRTCGSASHE